MVSEKKKQTVVEVKRILADYSVIGLIDMHKMPAKQLYEIRSKLKKDATIRMVKKRLIPLIFKDLKKNGLEKLVEKIQGQPALLMSNGDPFEISRIIMKSKSPAAAKAGDISPKDIIVKAGPTSLAAGPVIGELQRAKIPAGVDGEKISIKKDTIVVKEGEKIKKEVADIITKLGIMPMEIGLTLVAVWNDGYVYDKSILFIPMEQYISDIKQAASHAFNLAISINHYTSETVPFLISKAHREATSLALSANIITKDTIKPLLAKANAEAKGIENLVK